MTLRLDDAQAEAPCRKAAAEHRSMQQVVLAAIDASVAAANRLLFFSTNPDDFRGPESVLMVVPVPVPA